MPTKRELELNQLAEIRLIGVNILKCIEAIEILSDKIDKIENALKGKKK